MRKILTAVMLCFLIIVSAPFNTYSEKGESVKVGYVLFENYQEGKDGEYKRGFGYEYLQRIAYSTGWSYEYVYGSFSELLEKLENGEIDLMGDLSYTEERADLISYSALPQGKENYYIYSMVDNIEIDPMDLNTLNDKKVGVVSSSYQYSLLLNFIEDEGYKFEIADYSSSSVMKEDLHDGIIDAMVLTDMASSGNYLPIVSIGSGDFYFGVNKKRPDLLNELNMALREIQTSDPYYNEVTYSKYIGASSLSNAYLSKREREWLNNRNYSITLGYLDRNLPYCATDDNGELNGLLSLVVSEFKSLFNIDVKTVAYDDIESIMADIDNGKLDIFAPLYKDAWLAEKNNLLVSNAINTTTFVMFYDGELSEETYRSIAYAKNNAIQKGAIDVLYPDAKTERYNGRRECLQAILRGDVNSTIISSSALNRLKKYEETNKLTIMELPSVVEVCVGTSRDNAELLNITNRVILSCSDDLKGAALMDYTYEEPEFTLAGFIKENYLTVIIILILVIAFMAGVFAYYLNSEKEKKKLSVMAFKDALTRVGNRAGYLDRERDVQLSINSHEDIEFAIVLIDINNLKKTNDLYGHEKGDMLIKNTSRIICQVFDHSPVYRIGGDEFVVFLTGSDYISRSDLLKKLDENNKGYNSELNLENGETSFAYGMSEYIQNSDNSVAQVFKRADEAMYKCKNEMKKK
ncbi:MAG: diguanylate cyclase domain-containing protein [Erysipelotrichaceae bacterium]